MTSLEMALPARPVRSLPAHLATADPVAFGGGFHDEEVHGLDRYRWMGESGAQVFAPAGQARYLELWVLSEFEDLSQSLACGEEVCTLVAGWSPLSVTVPAGVDHLALRANKIFPAPHHPADGRVLTVRVRPPCSTATRRATP